MTTATQEPSTVSYTVQFNRTATTYFYHEMKNMRETSGPRERDYNDFLHEIFSSALTEGGEQDAQNAWKNKRAGFSVESRGVDNNILECELRFNAEAAKLINQAAQKRGQSAEDYIKAKVEYMQGHSFPAWSEGSGILKIEAK